MQPQPHPEPRIIIDFRHVRERRCFTTAGPIAVTKVTRGNAWQTPTFMLRYQTRVIRAYDPIRSRPHSRLTIRGDEE
jgi:hypothetical protein